ncbi:hypothetical protein LEN26_016753 [Aphanomyces euteiches]|nr:hypothetical protein LEN26_016753 [Aphanomyces euteiches]KAH9128849.1 hypothetical protein AeMF1_001035 [Aphanomyces euteiches]KAH9195442.1 hypothetical protein AeNC1_002574 [Aphanomyces euteiches]
MKFVSVAIVALVALLSTSVAAKDDKECEVCIKVIDTLKAQYDELLKESKGTPKLDVAQTALEKTCSKLSKKEKERKVCYFLEPMKKDAARQITIGKDTLKICKDLTKKNPDFCTIRFPIQVEAGTDYSTLRVKELKKILQERGVSCDECIEKSDLIAKLKATEHMEL